MHPKKLCIATLSVLGLLVAAADADFRISIPDVTVTIDGVNPTTGSFPILLEVEGVGAPNVNAPISSYNFQLDVTNVTGGLTVTSLTGSEGDIFSSISSAPFPFSVFSQGVSPLGFSEGANTLAQPFANAPATLNTPVVLANINYSIPAGQTGSFTVDFSPNPIEIFDDATPTGDLYAGVTSSSGTITAIPEPSAFLLLALVGSLTWIGKKKFSRRTRKTRAAS